MNKYYSKEKKAILCYKDSPTDPHFWDTRWENVEINKHYKVATRSYILSMTKRYLPRKSRIIEGGCGTGAMVMALNKIGYECIGVDNAVATLDSIRNLFPDLNIIYGDVKSLNFPSEHFDGYWSLGVIEHDINGFSSIQDEMMRVLRHGGYLFLSFPHMNILRKIKAYLGLYKTFNLQTKSLGYFYQYIYDVNQIKRNYVKKGFIPISHKYVSSLYGLETELPNLKRFQIILSSNKYTALFCKILTSILDISLNKIAGPYFSHSVVIVFKKA